MKQSINFPTKGLTLGLLSVLTLFVLAACTQESEEDMTVRVMAVPATVANVTLEVTDSSGATQDYVAVKNAENVAEVTVPSVPLGPATLVAKGSDASGTVLYRGSESINVVANMPTVSVLMSRLSSTLDATATSDVNMDAAEIITATVGGATQRLILNDAKSASGTLVGVATGSNLTVSAQSVLADGTVVRTGSASGVTVSEAGGAATIVLSAVPAGTQPPSVTAIELGADAPKVGVPYTVTVSATDPDGDLTSIELDWDDGNAPVRKDVSGGSATFTTTYTTPGSVTISATAFDAEGSNSLAVSATVTVESADPADEDSDVPVEIDVGDDLSQVRLTVTDVPDGTNRVQVALGSDALTGTSTAELAPTAAGWVGTLELPQNAQYSAVITTNPGEGSEDSTTASFTVGGNASADVTLDFGSDDGSGGGSGGDDNEAPSADAGSNQVVTDANDDGFETVTLDGSGSSDSDGTISYSWSLSGTEIATGATPTVTLSVGTNNITLTVTDDDGATDTDTVAVTVEAAPASTELAIVPVSTTCANTPVGGNCTLSVALQNNTDTFQAFEFDASFSNSNYSLVPLSATPGSLTQGWLVQDGNRPNGISVAGASGSGEIIKLTVQKNAAGGTTFTTGDGLIGGGDTPGGSIAGIAGGSLELP